MLYLTDDEVRISGSQLDFRLRYEVRLGLGLRCTNWEVFDSPWYMRVQLGTLNTQAIVVPKLVLATASFDLTVIPGACGVYEQWLKHRNNEVLEGCVPSFGETLLRVVRQRHQLRVTLDVERNVVWVQFRLGCPRVLARLSGSFRQEQFFYHRSTPDD